MKDEENEARFLAEEKRLEIQGSIGSYVSILPLSDTVETDESDGLKYPLGDLVFHRGETRSISNELTKESASVGIRKGSALVMMHTR